jgi:hypothetical protein
MTLTVQPAVSEVSKPEPRVATARSFQLCEETNNSWRCLAPAGTTKEDLEGPNYLSAIAGSLTDFDSITVIIEDRSLLYECLVVQGGRDGLTGIGGGRARMVVRPGYPLVIPPIDRNANVGLPENYSIVFDGFRGVHVPYWNKRVLNPDGFPVRDEARNVILTHSRQAARASASALT